MIFSEMVAQGGRLWGIPGGIRPHKLVNISTSIPLEILADDLCLGPVGISIQLYFYVTQVAL